MLGALSWYAASLISGTFEPYDSSAGLLVNQTLLSIPAVLLAWHYRVTVTLLFLVSAYLGMNVFAYALGGSEQRAWFALGALVSTLLFLAPTVLALGAVAFRRL
jgi:cytochrome bd-type quinol oxidase subunit 1